MKAGWQSVTIGETCDLSTGGTPSRTKPEYFNGGEIRWLVSGDVHQKEIFDCEGRITELGHENSNARYLPINSVIIALNGQGKTRGTVALLRTKATCNQSLVAISPRSPKALLPEYLYFNLHSRYNEIRRMTGDGGDERRGLNMPLLRGIRFPLPPLDEQKRIVAVLDEAFEGLSRARANAEANLADARELLENGINSLMASDPNAVETVLGALCSFENGDRGKNYPGRKAFVPSGVPFINAGHLLNGPIDWAEMNYIPLEHFHRLSNGKVKQGDLLFCLRGSLGKFGVVDSDEPGAIASSLVIVRPKKDRLHPSYLASYFKSKMCKDMIADFENGAAQPNLSAKNLAAFKIALPLVLHQEKVVTQVAELEDEVRGLVQLYEDQLSNLDALRQSLLQKAFSGELT